MKKRADGRYQSVIIIGRKSDGSYIKKSVYGRTRKELDDKIGEVKHQLKLGVRIDDNSTFKEITEIWLNHYRKNTEGIWAVNQRAILENRLLPVLGYKRIKEITRYDLQSIINDMKEKGLSTSTMKKVKIIAAQVFEVALDKKIVIENPFKKVLVEEIAPKERRPLTDDEINLITNTWRGHRMGVPAMVILYCGLRRGEILALKWSDIDFANKEIHINKAIIHIHGKPMLKGPKSKAGIRDVPIPNFLVELLKKVKPTSELFCPSVEGEVMTSVAYKRAWDSYLHYLNIQAGGRDASRINPKVQKVDRITAHMLRHTYATLLYDANVDIKSTQRYLGHSDIETTLEIYTHLTKHKQDESIRAINRHFEERFIQKESKNRSKDDRER
jgi:integrase